MTVKKQKLLVTVHTNLYVNQDLGKNARTGGVKISAPLLVTFLDSKGAHLLFAVGSGPMKIESSY